MKYDLLLKDYMLLTEDGDVKEHMSVAIKGNIIIRVARTEDMNVQAEKTLDGTGKLIMPGLVDAHTHTSQQLLRGSLADEFPMIWVRFLVPFESALTPEDVYLSALLYCLQAIKSGITSFAESGGRYMEQTVRAVLESGMRAAVSRSMMDVGGRVAPQMVESTQAAIEANDALYERYHGAGNDRVHIFYGMRQVMTCSPELVRLVAEHASDRGTGIHSHLCEHRDEVSFCLQNYGKRPAAFLDENGMLGPNLITAHSVALSESDISLLAARGVKTVHCPYANLINHGFPKTPRMLEAGCMVALGSDGAAYNSVDLFEEMRVLRASLICQWGLPVFDPVVMPIKELLRMATQGGAAALCLGQKLGRVKEGCIADLITIDMHKPHIYPSNNYTTAILDTVTAQDVSESIIDGKLVMCDRKVLTLDESAILAECADRMRVIVRRASIQGIPPQSSTLTSKEVR